MRTLLQQLRQDMVDRLATATTPEQRLYAIIDGNFADTQFDRPVIVAWLAFWAQVPHVPELARLQRVNARRLRSNLLHELRKLVPPPLAVETATGLAALIDGLVAAGLARRRRERRDRPRHRPQLPRQPAQEPPGADPLKSACRIFCWTVSQLILVDRPI